MCGINGYLRKSEEDVNMNGILKKMNQKILHRGPDDHGEFVYKGPDYTLGMAMRRLSIIDLNSGKQPIYSNSKQSVIVFNGEIYNYQELKKRLEGKGYVFTTNSDTEVIINLYDAYGTESFSMLDGMFAFSIFDIEKFELFIVRDFFGEKPLYYINNSQMFVWGSELKSLLEVIPEKKAIDKKALNLFFQLTYIPAPYTIYENVKKLEANHYLKIDCKTKSVDIIEIKQNFKNYNVRNKKEAIIRTHELVQQSVVSRSISDVPLGTFLSGGVDSSIVSLCLAQQNNTKIDTFSIGFEKKDFDETEKSKLVAKLINSNHHEFIISEKDLENNIDEIILNFDEPFADSSALPTYLVSKKTAKYVKVALTGDGGDEVFGGYNKYYMGKLNQKYTSLIPNKLHKKIVNGMSNKMSTTEDDRGVRFKIRKMLNSIDYDNDFYYNIISLGFSKIEMERYLLPAYYEKESLLYYKDKIGNNQKTLKDYRQTDAHLSLEGDLLVKVDRTSMLNSLECRAPFLNKELWNFSNNVPDNYLINNWDKKHILKEAFKQYFPKDFLNKSKKGFGVPVGDWLRSNLKNELLDFSDKKFLESQAIFNIDKVQELVFNHINKKIDNTFRVWTFYCFQKWYINNYEK